MRGEPRSMRVGIRTHSLTQRLLNALSMRLRGFVNWLASDGARPPSGQASTSPAIVPTNIAWYTFI